MSYPKQPPMQGAPGQYPPSGAAGQYPPSGAPGQYPPPGAPGQYPPPGAPGQYPPPGAPGQYPPHGAPGQYPPAGAPGHYPPSGAPGQYPPPGVPGQYPPHGAPGQYPPHGAPPGQYPPAGVPGQYPPPGAPGQYPPPGAPGQYPPPGVPGQYPPHGAPGHYPPPGMPGQYPPSSGFPVPHNMPGTLSGGGPSGWDADDSDREDYVRTKHSKHPITVKFINKTNDKVKLYWVDHKGKFKKQEKIKEGRIEVIQTYETHPFCAEGKKGPVINGNFLFIPQAYSGSHGELKAEITYGPKDRKSLRSKPPGHPVRMKFSNRTHHFITIKEIDEHGRSHPRKDIAPKKAWVVDTHEGRYFVACERGNDPKELDLNYHNFYLATRSANPQAAQKVLITEPFDDSSSSSSSD